MKKELDFDELHQAVNALMDEAGKPKVKKIPAESRATAPSTPAAARPATSNAESIPVSVKRTLPKVNSGRGARGQAMDVVGPKPAVKVTPPSAKPKRLAPSLQPVNKITPEPPVPQPPAMPDTPLDQPEDPAQKTGPTMTHTDHTWPDPLDLKQEAAAAEVEKAHLDAKPEEESATPFVTTKVEKRPLGAYTETAKPEEPAPEVPVPKEETPADPVLANIDEPSKPSQMAVQQPKELSPEVVAVESAEPEFHPETTVKPESNDPPTQDELRTMAIPQQYQTTEKEASAEERPVFDTKEYHPAIEAHTSRPRSNAWVMIIIFIVVLGLTLAVAYYVITGGFDLSALLG